MSGITLFCHTMKSDLYYNDDVRIKLIAVYIVRRHKLYKTIEGLLSHWPLGNVTAAFYINFMSDIESVIINFKLRVGSSEL